MWLTEGEGRSLKTLIFGIVVTDLAFRYLPKVVGLGDNLFIPASSVVISGIFLQWSTISWVLGWVLYGTVIIQISPLLFPLGAYHWAHGIVSRLGMGLSTVLLGMFIEKAIIEAALPLIIEINFGTTPFPFSFDTLPLAVIIIVLILVVSRVLPGIGLDPNLDTKYLTSFDKDLYAEAYDSILVTQHLALVVVLAVLLAELSLLFPLPELLIIAIVGYDFGGYLLNDASSLPARREFAERIVQAGTAVWQGPRWVVQIFYIMLGLFFLLFIDYFYISILNPVDLIKSNLISGLFVNYSLIALTIFAGIALIRFAERLPANILRSQDTENLDKMASYLTPPGKDKEILPELLFIAGIILMCLEQSRINYDGEIQLNKAPEFILLKPMFFISVVAGAIGFLLILYPHKKYGYKMAEYKITILSVTAFVAGWGFGFTSIGTMLIEGQPVQNILGQLLLPATYLVVSLSIFIGYEISAEMIKKGTSITHIITIPIIWFGSVLVLSFLYYISTPFHNGAVDEYIYIIFLISILSLGSLVTGIFFPIYYKLDYIIGGVVIAPFVLLYNTVKAKLES